VARGHDVPLVTTSEKIAADCNVSERTIKRDAQFAKGLNAIAEVVPEIKTSVLQGKSELTKKEVAEFAKIEKPLLQSLILCL